MLEKCSISSSSFDHCAVAEAFERRGRPGLHLRELKHEERPLFDARPHVRRHPRRSSSRSFAMSPVKSSVSRASVASAKSIEQQSNREQLGEAIGRDRVRSAIAAFFDQPRHADPTTQREQRCRNVFFPLVFGHAQRGQRFVNRVERRHVAVGPIGQLPRQVAQPALGRRRREADRGR